MKTPRRPVAPSLLPALVLSVFLFCPVRAADGSDIPTEYSATSVVDPVAAPAAEMEDLHRWAAGVFADPALCSSLDPAAKPPVEIVVRRQDHSTARFGQSCVDTPLRIGSRDFAHGLGTHAASEILIRLPEGARRFRASVGVDNNFDTAGQRGSVRFSIEIDGREVFRTSTVKCGEEPLAVEVEIPAGARELVLKVDPTEDGAAHDQADWADARIDLGGGRTVWLDEGQRDPFLREAGPPFSFVYDGKPSRELLSGWKMDRGEGDRRGDAGRIARDVSWTDPRTGLRVTARITLFRSYPAVEWVLEFENTGAARTPILEDVQAIDVELRTGSSKKPVALHQISGDVCGEKSFLPMRTDIAVGKDARFAPVGGRSSNGTFPFFSTEYGDEGVIAAVGWSGQWAASIQRMPAGPTRLRAGMERTRLWLDPGERIRTPRILLLPWKGERVQAHNRLRRLLLFHYVPRFDGKPAALPFASQCFDRYSWTRPEWATEAGQVAAARFARSAGLDTHWLDAAWFIGGFPNGVGNWLPRPAEFPRGLRPVGDECRSLGLRFVLWFEPERVARGSAIAREHPEFVHGGAEGGLFRLGDPTARRWMTDLLSKRIEEWGIDIYRNDFNMEPLPFWRSSDPPDREGITEIRYVEGLYAMWDELRARRPGLLIDNCASGGRRIDLETCSRSVPFWRSEAHS